MDTTDAPQIIEHANKSLSFTPYDTKWVPCSARFVVMGIYPKGKGALQMYELDGGEVKAVAEHEMPSGLKCGTFGASSLDARHLATGDYDGTLAIWDLSRPDTATFEAKGHTSIINAIDGVGGLNLGHGAQELVTGGRDGCVRVWDPRVPEPVLSLEPGEGEAARDCWATCFGNSYNDEERCVGAGYDNGDVKLWDLRANAMLWETNCANGVVGLEFDRVDIPMNKLLVATLESKFRVFDARTLHPEEGFACLQERAHKATVWQGRHLPQNRDLFMTGGGNGGLNVYKYSYPSSRTKQDADGRDMGVAGTVELLNSRVVSTQPIVSFDWSPDKEGLCVFACLDQTVRVSIVTKLHKF